MEMVGFDCVISSALNFFGFRNTLHIFLWYNNTRLQKVITKHLCILWLRYRLYTMDRRSQLRQKYPDMSFAEQVRKMGAEWSHEVNSNVKQVSIKCVLCRSLLATYVAVVSILQFNVLQNLYPKPFHACYILFILVCICRNIQCMTYYFCDL